ncbi:MAG: MarR family transcriptional regulator [Oscillospiraceae bacterium]|nr:MarR family transcriptional regulator [Oscillospiraceae bacterium]
MSRGEQALSGFWGIFNKISWLDSVKMKDLLKDYYPSEIHCVDYIGKNAESNVTKLAESFNMTRSAISKLAKKMVAKNLIESYQAADNKKEIYFRLTEHGQTVFEIHEKLHDESHERDRPILEKITEEQYDSMLVFAEIYNKHLDKEIEKLGINAKKGLDKL